MSGGRCGEGGALSCKQKLETFQYPQLVLQLLFAQAELI